MANSGQATSTVAVVDVSAFSNYLRRVASVLLEDAEDTPEALKIVLKERPSIDSMKKFLNDPQIPVLLIQRTSAKDDSEVVGTEGDEKETFLYSVTSEVLYSNAKVRSVVVIKREPKIEADKLFSSQLELIKISDGSPCETFHAIISNAVAPYFKSYVQSTEKADRGGDEMSILKNQFSVEKKMEELELGLWHLQQNIVIPEINLTVHPMVATMIKKCSDEGRKAKVVDFGDEADDASFLNALHNCVNRWTAEIKKVTKLDRDPSSGTTLQEINFWLSLERALLRIQEKRENQEIQLTLDILRAGQRFLAFVSFDLDTGLKQALATVNDYNPLMKDFPLNDLLSATELDRIRSSLVAIFAHLKKIRNTHYPITRALGLVEAISRDLSSQMLKVLGTRRLMHIQFKDFEKVMRFCFHIFLTWDDEYEKLLVLLRDIVKKKENNSNLTWRVTPVHEMLQKRLEQIREFRRQHKQLRQVIVRVLPPSVAHAVTATETEQSNEPAVVDAADINSVEEVNMAYDNVKEVDCLDVSRDGSDAWEAASKRYDECIDQVEKRITARLRDQLGTAKNANEMFRIFSRFNGLFVRPHIRGAILEYQTLLIQRVKDDIESLHEKFKVQYSHSKASHMSQVRDIPPVSGSIIWTRQIERQLNTYMRRVEDALGKGWENHVEGQKLKADADSFLLKLNTRQLFDDWLNEVQNKPLAYAGRIFSIESARSRQPGKGNMLRLKVNFTPEIITLSKEVRNLKRLGFRVPFQIFKMAHTAETFHPFAISLHESVNSYERTCDKVEERPSIALLVDEMQSEVEDLILKGADLEWESHKLDSYVQKVTESIFLFQEKVDDLLVIEEQIDLEVKALDTCPYSHSMFTEVLAKVQKHVDDLSLHQYSNLPQWVARLDQEVQGRLAARLEAGVKAWTRILQKESKDEEDVDRHGYGHRHVRWADIDTDAPVQSAHKPGGEPKLKKFIHELRITNQLMYLSPPVEEASVNLLNDLDSWESIVTTLPRITHARYQVGVDTAPVSETHYKNLLTKLPSGHDALDRAYEAVEKIVRDVNDYVHMWLDYQALWDPQADYSFGKLGIDTSETSKDFGPIRIEFGNVQSAVSLKYDSWRKEVLGEKFGNMLGTEIQVLTSRNNLEQQPIETANTTSVAVVQTPKRKPKSREKQGSSVSSPIILVVLIVMGAMLWSKPVTTFFQEAVVRFLLSLGMTDSNELVFARMPCTEIDLIYTSLIGPSLHFVNQYFETFFTETVPILCFMLSTVYLCYYFVCRQMSIFRRSCNKRSPEETP